MPRETTTSSLFSKNTKMHKRMLIDKCRRNTTSRMPSWRLNSRPEELVAETKPNSGRTLSSRKFRRKQTEKWPRIRETVTG